MSNIIYIIKATKNEYNERHIDSVVRDEVVHHKSGIYVTKNNGFVRDADTMLACTAAKLHNLLIENAYNGYFSRELNNQYKAQVMFEKRLQLQRA